MSEEAAFLAALKANPADDTARLVYADWLDEHDQHAKAQYLRAVADLARLSGGTPECTDAAERLYAACATTHPVWRRDAGARFDVVLERYESSYKIQSIKIIRERTGIGLAEAKALAESVPTPLFSWLTFEQALPHLLAFYPGGPRGRTPPIDAALRPTAWPAGAIGAVFDVLLCEYHREPHWGLHGLAQLVGLTTNEVRDRLGSLPLVLAVGLLPAAVADFVRRVKMACNFSGRLPPDAIRVVPRLPNE